MRLRIPASLNLIVRYHLLYVFVALGFCIFFAGLALVPGYWKFAWGLACIGILAVLPSVLAKVLDPINSRRIFRHLRDTGATDISIEPYPNHYGVRFLRDGVAYYAKCRVVKGKVKVSERASAQKAK